MDTVTNCIYKDKEQSIPALSTMLTSRLGMRQATTKQRTSKQSWTSPTKSSERPLLDKAYRQRPTSGSAAGAGTAATPIPATGAGR